MMDLTGLKQIALSKKIGISQGTLNRWLNRVNVPNKTQWDRVMTVWREIQGIKLTIDQKIAPYDVDTQLTIHKMLDNYLRLLPPPRPRRGGRCPVPRRSRFLWLVLLHHKFRLRLGGKRRTQHWQR
jgi:hypothetical protein